MSGADGNFVTRWSRRKREALPPPSRGKAGVGVAPGSDEEALLHRNRGPEAKEHFERSNDPSPQAGGKQGEPLPSLDDLTAESGLGEFLRAGVPEALTTAALRRMWSLDPAIRDFVGPAEYAYDYNTPGAIPGFGAAPEWDASAAKRYVQRSASPSVAEASTPMQQDQGAPEPGIGARAAGEYQQAQAAPSDADETTEPSAQAKPLPADSTSDPAHEHSDAARAGAPARRHGGALPR
jgi:hypothetical protein